MARWLGQILVSLFALSFPVSLSLPQPPAVAVRPAVSAPARLLLTDATPAVAAAGVAAVDAQSGAVLFAQGSDRLHPLASITKLMTALVVSEGDPDWQSLVTIRETDQRNGGRVLLVPGEQVSLEDLFQAMLVASSNESAVALARSTGLTPQAFVAVMNRKASASGLDSLRFVDVAGLEPDNVGNARDVARLGLLALGNPMVASAVTRQSYTVTIRNTGRPRQAVSTNQLLRLMSSAAELKLRGGKTGYLDEVGYNLVVVFEEEGNQVGVALLGARSAEVRWQESLQLAHWIYSHYRWPALGG